MSSRIAERVAVLSTTLGVCGVVLFLFAYEARAASAPLPLAHTVTLTEVASTGEWTDDYRPTVHGQPHWGMRGAVAVQRAETQAVPVPPQSIVKYWLDPPPAQEAGIIARGKWLFHQRGCFLCHGQEGKGGVPNRNYVRDTIPALERLAERMMLFDSASRNAILDQMKRGSRLEALTDSPPVPRFNVFLAQYRTFEDVIRKGSVARKKDPNGPTPPLRMPAWGQVLSDADIDAVVAYLLTLQPSNQPGN